MIATSQVQILVEQSLICLDVSVTRKHKKKPPFDYPKNDHITVVFNFNIFLLRFNLYWVKGLLVIVV